MKHNPRVFSDFQTHNGRCRCGVEAVRVGLVRIGRVRGVDASLKSVGAC